MNIGLSACCVRYIRRSCTVTGFLRSRGLSGHLFTQPHRFSSGGYFTRTTYRYYSSDTNSVSNVVRLDSQGGTKLVYDNFGRLRVFIKFLCFQSVPLAIFAYFYKRFEGERRDLYSVPLDTVEDALRHFFSITKGAQCFLLLGNQTCMVNYSIGQGVNFSGVDSLESFFDRLQPQFRDSLQHIRISYPSNITLEVSETENRPRLLFYNSSLDSFGEIAIDIDVIIDPEQKQQLWVPRLGSDSNNLAVCRTSFIRLGFGGSDRCVQLQKREDWRLLE
ncbi:hypothetical protein BBOV_I000580 [Babesia bovis T2Bo]|uniref:Uncharacterized protein n=1 Tax=Babesia bovis TaxID=5865 RepID=A7AX79_BABBO|nr:hypothetical protein BBOV_I000580 [Babesia bovis T2Bo]EDO05152.1 hypothetical protein BBOV_I000580 [Babesia bovis T2Bo]|eukprot:XP_001608720.1 hypothetical protein [Babesia bovis T2Bo]